jgi:hypothetical protein
MPNPGSNRRLMQAPDWLPPCPAGEVPRFGRNVPMEWVVTEPGFNLRTSGTSPADLDALGQALQTGGQLYACIGERLATGQILLIDGHRRFAAAKRAGLKTLWVEGFDKNAPPIERFIVHAVSNLARRELTVPERAEVYERLGKAWQASLGGPDAVSAGKIDQMIAYRCAVSRQQVGQYRRFVQKLHPDVIAAWKAAPEHITVKWLDRVVQLAHPEQKKALEDRRRELEATELPSEGEKTKTGPHLGAHKPSKRRLETLLVQLEGRALSGYAAHLSEDEARGIMSGLMIALGRAHLDKDGRVVPRDARPKIPPVTILGTPAPAAVRAKSEDQDAALLDVPEFEE